MTAVTWGGTRSFFLLRPLSAALGVDTFPIRDLHVQGNTTQYPNDSCPLAPQLTGLVSDKEVQTCANPNHGCQNPNYTFQRTISRTISPNLENRFEEVQRKHAFREQSRTQFFDADASSRSDASQLLVVNPDDRSGPQAASSGSACGASRARVTRAAGKARMRMKHHGPVGASSGSSIVFARSKFVAV